MNDKVEGLREKAFDIGDGLVDRMVVHLEDAEAAIETARGELCPYHGTVAGEQPVKSVVERVWRCVELDTEGNPWLDNPKASKIVATAIEAAELRGAERQREACAVALASKMAETPNYAGRYKLLHPKRLIAAVYDTAIRSRTTEDKLWPHRRK